MHHLNFPIAHPPWNRSSYMFSHVFGPYTLRATIRTFLLQYMGSHPRRQQSSSCYLKNVQLIHFHMTIEAEIIQTICITKKWRQMTEMRYIEFYHNVNTTKLMKFKIHLLTTVSQNAYKVNSKTRNKHIVIKKSFNVIQFLITQIILKDMGFNINSVTFHCKNFNSYDFSAICHKVLELQISISFNHNFI
jgi:hypothetical protein